MAGPQVSQGIVVESGCAEVELPGRGKRNLIETLLGTDLSNRPLGEGDHKLLDAFIREAVSDLLSHVDEMAAGKGRDGTMVTISLFIGPREIGALRIPDHVLVPAMKAAIGRSLTSESPPRSYVEALRPIPLSVEAILGQVDLTFADLKTLAVGDVIVLDSGLQDPVEVRLAGSERRVGRGALGRNNDRPSIHF
jgi:flagellar motor switch/type III secretory pathway protein FliN